MKEDKPVICRLCLNLIEDGSFDLLDEVKKQMLNTLLPNMNLACPTQPVICKHCTTVLHNSYHFKTEFLNYMKNVEPQIKDKKHQCIYCLTVTKQECTAAENILLKEMLTQCFPENDVIESTSICEKCVEPLHSQYIFVSKCLEVEEKITVYSSKTGSSGEVNLFDVVNDKYTLKESNNIRVDFVSLKTEPIDFPDPITIEEKDIKDVELIASSEKEDEFPTPASLVEKHSITIKSDKGKDVTQREKTKIYKCELCDYKTHRKSDLTLRHMLRHKNPEELKMYRCTECSYQTKRRGDLTSHLVTHKDSVPVYKCATCHYKTIYKDRLAEHVVKHKLPEKYKCNICDFTASYKKSLNAHMKFHKREMKNAVKKVFKCHFCPYETRRKTDLVDKHMLTHKLPDEVIWYKCLDCDYQAKHKCSLTRHVLRHKSEDEIIIYRCSQCDFTSREKRYLTIHEIKNHKTPEEVTMYKCEHCSYETKLKFYLKRHMTIHRKKMYKCQMCAFETTTNTYLKKHMVRHASQLLGSELLFSA